MIVAAESRWHVF